MKHTVWSVYISVWYIIWSAPLIGFFLVTAILKNGYQLKMKLECVFQVRNYEANCDIC